MDLVFQARIPTDARLVTGADLGREQRFDLWLGKGPDTMASDPNGPYIVWGNEREESQRSPNLFRIAREYMLLAQRTPEKVLDFVNTWGVRAGEDGVVSVSRWMHHAQLVERALAVLIASSHENADGTVGYDASPGDLTSLWLASKAADLRPDPGLFGARDTDVHQWVDAHQRKQHDERLAEQRRLVARFVQVQSQGLYFEASWDDRRSVVVVAPGVHWLIGAFLRQVFESDVGVFVCGGCRRPRTADPGLHAHRPRADRQRFCSEDCRALAGNARRLEWWHKNKNRLNDARRLKQGAGGEPETQQEDNHGTRE